MPEGFYVCSQAYDAFVTTNQLREHILELASRASVPASLVRAAEDIKNMFAQTRVPDQITKAVLEAYGHLGTDSRVAVRSSANAEDLPEQSFAGQHDTYLNIHGGNELLEAIRNCWASLWNASAIGYRNLHDVSHGDVRMAVVVQVMVPAEVSGILFTANPTTGERSELIVNASFGLGEAIVSGQVTPDTFVVDRDSGSLKESHLGTKHERTTVSNDQGVNSEPVPQAERDLPSLSVDELKRLTELSLRTEKLFGGIPQDIEWAISEDHLYLLQARPITRLPPSPIPDIWEPPEGTKKLVRRQVVENMPGPLSPLFEDLYLERSLPDGIDGMLKRIGMPFDIEKFIEGPMFATVNGYAYMRADYNLSWQLVKLLPKVLYFYVTALPKIVRNLVSSWRDEDLPRYLDLVDQWRAVDPVGVSDAQLANGISKLTSADAHYWFSVSMMVGVAKISEGALHYFLGLASRKRSLTSGMFLRGFPSKTIEAQECLEALANSLRSDAILGKIARTASPEKLLNEIKHHPIGENLQHYLKRFGHQVYTLDFVEPTQVEDPLPVVSSLKAMVDVPVAISSLQARLSEERLMLERQTMAAFGPIRRWAFRKLLGWAQKFGPHREEALFYIGSAWPTLRALALELGRRLTARGFLDSPEGVFYLRSEEISNIIDLDPAAHPNRDIPSNASIRAAVRERILLRDARKRLHAPGFVPVGGSFRVGPIRMTMWETQKRNDADSDVLEGFPVSPGQVTGTASVIMSPADFSDMIPDTILVCPTTTPAWTPLFSQARGLVTDIGGILAHGSIVAREYGIPAVLGTGSSTKKILTGQRIKVDGSAGTVTLLDDAEGPA